MELLLVNPLSAVPTAAISRGTAVTVATTSTSTVLRATTAGADVRAIGIAAQDGSATGGPIPIAVAGMTTTARVDGASTAIAANDMLKVGTAGDLIKATADGEWVVAIALEPATTDNAFIQVVVSPFSLSVPA
jgi:hypothetical protein